LITILGIHDGHNSGATLLQDGKVTYSISEERLTKNKNEIGYPSLSIDEVLGLAGISSKDLNLAVYASNFMHTESHLRNASQWYKAGKKEYLSDSKRDKSYLKAVFDQRRRERLDQLNMHLNIDKDKIKFQDHHECHGAAAYFGSPFVSNKDTLVLTCDGAGDGLSATVSIANGNDIKRISQTSRKASLGKIYSRVTYMLGLKPWEHEYKVMGLAPYAEKESAEEIKDILNQLLKLSNDGLGFELASEHESSYIYEFLRNKFECKRFDAIAGGVQIFTEELLRDWVKGIIKKTGIQRIVCGGGVFMNVKANKIISELEDLKELFVFPSCGDESLSFGAAWLEYVKFTKDQSKNNTIKPFRNLYLGGIAHQNNILDLIENNINSIDKISVKKSKNISKELAAIISNNKVVARCTGRMEWGARALGNRSILANPKDWSNVEKINDKIKKRDFWMPFAPSILKEKASKYLINPKNISSPYMMLAFDTTKLALKDITASIHPRDRTARAQIVDKLNNLGYWELINEFYKISGIPCLLNTSFNLHGYPLVYDVCDAIHVFKNSGLDILVLDEYILTKSHS
tara:strand:+ start:799 stop:2523 length:1725 start_codon:yes stop_codon:yes gene_type:complete